MEPAGKSVDPAANNRLEGWKEIAAYLKREVRTVQRWEKNEGLPVQRHEHDKLSTVYAYKAELDAWCKNRRPQADDRQEEEREREEGQPVHVGKLGDIEKPAGTIHHLPAPKPARRVLVSAAVALVLVCATYFAWKYFINPAPVHTGRVTLAVLPFDNLSGDPQQDYISDGLSDEMIMQLSRLQPERMGVTSWTSIKVYKHTSKTAGQIGRELGVDYLLEGSVSRAGNKVRVRAQLIQARDQTHLWADSYERDFSDVLALQSEVAQAVAGQIRLKLTEQQHARLANPRSVGPEAHEAYWNGRYFWHKRYESDDALKKSLEYFEEAINKDPNFPLAYAGLADTYSLLGSNSIDELPPRKALPKAKQAALRALELDDALAEAHASLAYIKLNYDWDLRGAETEFKRALELNANYATAHEWYGSYLLVVGRLDEALAESRRAHELEPTSLIINIDVAWKLYMVRRYDGAIEQCRKTVELNPNLFLTYYVLGMAYERKGMYPEAISEFQKGKGLFRESPIMSMALGQAFGVSGRTDEARRALAELRSLSNRRYVPALYMAALYAGLSDKGHALQWLEKALEERSDQLVYLKTEPMADPLRSDPQFQKLLRRIGLPP